MSASDKVIRESDAMELMWEVAKRTGFSSKESTLFELLLKSCPRLEVGGEHVFRLVDLKGFLANFQKAIETKDVSFLTQQRGLCVDRIVDVIEFVESPEFMGQRGYLRPRIKEALWELFSKEQYVEAVLCLRGNTRVPLLDGTMPTIRELSKLPPSEKFWLYSQVDGKVVPAQGRFAHKTGRDVIWRVTFDDGTYIETNGRHRLVDVYGNKVMVKDLKPGDRLSSFYAHLCKMAPSSRAYLREVNRQSGGRGEFIHRMVMEAVSGAGYRNGWVIHHKNFNPLDNRPENLEWLPAVDHARVHADLSRRNISLYNKKPFEYRSMIARRNAKMSRRWESEEQRRRASERMTRMNLMGLARFAAKCFWESEEGAVEKEIRAARMREFNLRHPRRRDDLSGRDLIEVAGRCRVFKDLCRELDCSVTKVYSPLRELGMDYHTFKSMYMCKGEPVERVSNHVVSKVECLGIEDDVFCLTVDGPGVFFVQVEGGGDDGLCLNCVLSSNTGAIGVGKNYMADMALAYMLYRLSCYHNPQLEYDLAPGSSIFFIQQSITRTLAKKVVFEQFAERLKQSPYFQKHFPFDPQIKSELRFPKNIYVIPIGGSDTGALGMNVFGGIIDELNFMARVRDSVYTMYTGEEEYDQAEKLYSTLIRRMKSRFMQKGKLPGKLLLVSSSNYEGDFTDRKIEEAKTDKTIFVMKLSQWEALPDDRFSGEKFLVEVGNEYKQSRIISSREEAIDEEDVIEVPVEYKPEFERDINAALRDLAGIASSAKHPFIPYRELIVRCFEEFEKLSGGRQLFRHDSVVLSNLVDPFAPDWELVVDTDYLEEVILDRRQVFAVHIDIGLSQDAAGIAIGRINSYKLLPNTRYFNERTQEFVEVTDIRAPIYTIDGAMQVKAPPGGEVDLELLRDLVLFLRGELNVKWGTCDSYQSVMLLQSFRKARIRSGVLSVDASLSPYSEVKMAIKEERLLLPRNSILWRELRELEKNKDKVDHLPGGSKDVADAVAGVVYILQRKEASYGRAARRRRPAAGAAGEDVVRKVRVGGQRRRSLRSIV